MDQQRKNETLIKEFGNLQSLYFDRSFTVDREINFFVQEFETKRGDADIRALKQLQELMKDTSNRIVFSKQAIEANVDSNSLKVAKLTEAINNYLPKENAAQEARDAVRASKAPSEAEQRSKVLIQQEEEKKKVDAEFEESKKALHLKYNTTES